MNTNKAKEGFYNTVNKTGIFHKKKLKQKPVSTKTGGGVKAFMSKLSGAFLLPIAILAVAGLFLGIGATIAGNTDIEAVRVLGEFIKQLGDPLFGALPLLFCAAIVISFTEEAGVGVFNAIVGYLVFSAIQSVFIEDVIEPVKIGVGLGENGGVDLGKPIYRDDIVGYNILFSGPGRESKDLKQLVGTTLGIKSLQTSVFGGILVGLGIQWAYNKFHTIKLPTMFAFFSGKRFVAFVVVALMIPYAFFFLLVWPYVGYAFSWFGQNSGKIPYGFDSFIFGFIERSLVPFGLHHVFYAPLWYTAAGADVQAATNEFLKAGNQINPNDLKELAGVLKGSVGKLTVEGSSFIGIHGASVFGDSTTSLALLGYNGNDIRYTLKGSTEELSKPLFMFIQDELDLKIGRFLQGKFPFMQWGLPFAGLAMVMAAPKENRKVALGVVFPASLTCFVTGVTEPIEFTFLFLAPAMFFGFHALMCATSFLLMNILSVHIAQSFSGGFLDLMLYGAVPVLKGTNFWWTFIVGAGYAPIYFVVFYFWIIKANLPTPGRGGNTKLFTKKDYISQKDSSSSVAPTSSSNVSSQIAGIIAGFGGKENIVKTANCASRLRFDVVSADRVSEAILKQYGAFGLRRISDNHVQAIFGPKSEQLRVEIDNALRLGGGLSASMPSNPVSLPQPQSVPQPIKSNTNTKTSGPKASNKIYSPVNNGKLKPLSELNDGVFSEKVLGDGFAVAQSDGKVYAPISGELVAVFPTGHAYGIKNENGLNVLVHIGIDTVNLNGKGFTPHVKQGQKVKQGELLADVDLKVLEENKCVSDVIVVVTEDSTVKPKGVNIKSNAKTSIKDVILSKFE